MQKYKYALDLEENIYSLNSDFDTYKLSIDEIKKLYSEPISDKDSKYIDRKIVYDHTYIYLTPGEFIEQYKLHNNQTIELYEDIGKIKIKDITSENIKDISFILHRILKIKSQEEADVHGYEMPISNSWQYIPFNQKMNFNIGNVLNRQNKSMDTEKKLNNYMSINIQDTLSLSDAATNILNQNLGKSKTVNNLNEKEDNFLVDTVDLQSADNFKNLYTHSKQICQNNTVEESKPQPEVIDLKKLEYKTFKYDDVKDILVPKDMREGNKNISYKFSRQIVNYFNTIEKPDKNKEVPPNPLPELATKQITGNILGSNSNIDCLIQDNHPEKILGNGVGIIGEHTISKGNNLLTSYHENCVSEDKTTDKDRNIVYNFNAKKDGTEITFNRTNFSVDKDSGVKAGASVVGEKFKEGNTGGIMKNGYIFTKDKDGNIIQVESKDKIIQNKNDTVTVKLNKDEIFSFTAPESLKEKNIFASAMEFYNNEEVTLDIRSVSEQLSNTERCGEIKYLPLTDPKTQLSNLDDKGNPKQVSGVFQNPNYEITGHITAGNKDNVDSSSIIMIPPFKPELDKKASQTLFSVKQLKPPDTESVEAVADKDGIKNKGCFSQNFHYKLKIDNYNSDKQYAVILIPGGGEIGYQTQDGFIKVSHPSKTNNNPNQAIIIPTTPVNKETGEIEFDYFIAGGSSTPVYAKVIEADTLSGTQ